MLLSKTVEARRPFQMMVSAPSGVEDLPCRGAGSRRCCRRRAGVGAQGLPVRSHLQKIRDQLQVQQLSEQVRGAWCGAEYADDREDSADFHSERAGGCWLARGTE